MRGSVFKRGRTWSFAIDVGKDAQGRRKKKWSSGYPTKKAAQAAMRDFQHRVDSGADPFPENQTVGDYLDRWLSHKAGQVRETTFARYQSLVAHPELETLKGLDLTRVRPAHVQAVLDALSKRFSANSVRQSRAVLGGAFKQAVAWGLITSNPVQAAQLPQQPGPPDIYAPTPQQLRALMEASKDTPWEIPMLLSAVTGARRSEVLGLCWDQVDFTAARIRIVRGLQRTSGGTHFLDVKTKRAKRPIALTPAVTARLKAHKQEQNERRLALGPMWTDLNLVCERGDGVPLHPDAFSHAFKRLAAKVGLPADAHLHCVRHGVATALMRSGVHAGVTSATLGHSSPAFTLAVYSHMDDGMAAQAADVLGEVLGL